MNTKNTKAVLGLLLILGLMQLSPIQAEANSLTQLDIRKGQSDSSVEVTLYTTDPYGDNVAVTKKADNTYVILMPNLSGSSGAAPDISGIKDVVSDVDVKFIDRDAVLRLSELLQIQQLLGRGFQWVLDMLQRHAEANLKMNLADDAFDDLVPIDTVLCLVEQITNGMIESYTAMTK